MSVITDSFVVGTLGLILWIVGSFLWKYFKLRGLINKLPGPHDYPFIGNIHILPNNFVMFYKKMLEFSREYKDTPVFRIWLGIKPVIVCHTAESMECILSNSVHINKSYFYSFIAPWLGEGLLLASGSNWKAQRKMLTPAFHFKILNDFIPIFNEQSRILVDNLLKEANTDAVFDIFHPITLATLDIICETAMGKAIHAQTEKSPQYVSDVLKLSDDVMFRMIRPWLHPDIIYHLTSRGRKNLQILKAVHKFRTDVIQERKIILSEQCTEPKPVIAAEDSFQSKRRLAFLDLLIEYQTKTGQLTDEDIGDQVDTFMFEGHDTTAASITWTLYLLGRNPEVQEKLHEELDALFVEDQFRDIELADTNKMPYLEKIIKESLRLFPSVPFIGRLTETDSTIAGYHVPKGTDILLSFIGLHRNEAIYPNPDKFCPERFDAANRMPTTEKRSSYEFVPFSAGPRNCIGAKFAGLEEKIVLASIMRRFSIEAKQEIDEVAPSTDVILRPSNKVLVKLYSRST